MNQAEQATSRFYNTVGWAEVDGLTEDARRFEDLRPSGAWYVSQCRLRVLRHIPQTGEFILDMASGPIQYPEYLEYSKGYRRRYCVDLSEAALQSARQKIGEHGEYLHGSFFDIDLPENHFDCSISLHTLYHIDRDLQERAVRKLLKVTKPGCPVIVVYSNPDSLRDSVARMRAIRALREAFRTLRGNAKTSAPDHESPLYYFPHSNHWWRRFEDAAEVSFFPWRSFNSTWQKRLFPNNIAGSAALRLLFRAEDLAPSLFVRWFQYPMVVLMKRDLGRPHGAKVQHNETPQSPGRLPSP